MLLPACLPACLTQCVCKVGFPDHHAPPLNLLCEIVQQITRWLDADPGNVAVVHCRAGKGRTGTVISCCLLYMGLSDDVHFAMETFASRRSRQKTGVTNPSQIRCVPPTPCPARPRSSPVRAVIDSTVVVAACRQVH